MNCLPLIIILSMQAVRLNLFNKVTNIKSKLNKYSLNKYYLSPPSKYDLIEEKKRFDNKYNKNL